MKWLMPDLGEGVQEGEIIKWLVKAGDTVEMDQPLLEVMTDKATVELPSPSAGVIKDLQCKEGDIVKIKFPLATIETAGSTKQSHPHPSPLPSRERVPVGRERGTQVVQPPTAPRPTENFSTTNVLASPAVRRMAREQGIDLSRLQGVGPGGRILTGDLSRGFAAPTIPGLAGIDYGTGKRIPLRGLRRKIAEHMSLSRKVAAHFTHVDEADLTALVAFREKQKEIAKKEGIKLTFLPFIMKAVAKALQKFPYLNASLDENTHEIVLKNEYHIGFATATDEGLIVPHIKNVDRLSVFQVAAEISRLTEAVRNNKAALTELKGSTFTVTNVGSVGGIVSMPIVNYPEVGIMGVHKIEPRPVVYSGDIVIRQMTYFSVSADHRVADGAYVAQFLNEVMSLLQKPQEL